MRRDLPRGTVTFLFTDVEGSTRLLRTLGPEAYAIALADHRQIVRDACAANGGVEVDNQGDAFFFAFPDAGRAAAAAEAMTVGLASGTFHLRIGLHTGTPLLTEEGYVGDDVHLAARVAASGHGGQIVVSAATAALLTVDLMELGEHRLKDIDRAVPLFQLGRMAHPPLKTISNTNLPRPTSSFVGREEELGEVLAKVANGARLTTLTGPGGTGKTRLAIEAAASLVGNYKAGVFWVGLAALRDAALVTEVIAQTIGAKAGLAEDIGEREMLLLVDNLEQVIDCAPALSALLHACPNLALLVTSRELLRIQGEVEYKVAPLDAREAVALFCERTGLEPNEEIAELCARLDSLPLAVELAAARTRALSPAQILERLAKRLDLLKGGRDADPRQQTLRATIEWSHDLLSTAERKVFAQLSVFAGGWTLESAESVCNADIDPLQALVEKSLIRYANERYLMLATIREFASGQAEASDPDLQRRHAEFYRDLVVGTDAKLRGDHEDVLLDALEKDHDNIRAALTFSIDHDPALGMRIAVAMNRFWWIRGTNAEARRWLDALLAEPDQLPADLYARGLADYATIVSVSAEWDVARAKAEEAIRIAGAMSDRDVAYRALSVLAEVHGEEGRPAEAESAYAEALLIARETGNRYREAATAYNLGSHHQRQGELDRARALMEQALRLAEELGLHEGIASTHVGLGSVLRQQGEVAASLEMLQRGLAELTVLGFPSRMAWALIEVAAIMGEQEDAEAAARLLGAATAIISVSGAYDVDELASTVESQLVSALGQQRFSELRAEGRALTIDNAMALAGVSSAQMDPSGAALTPGSP